ncbi:hypothetical protein AUR64_07180 [Haloprofundus marisrubri]|uniref:Uncharacterized protein n=1 Tax=Haloprofundus marisrubri TaxID=1514971 RepID=A0A0W1RC26_9EURY|nr:hypothetical protein [Haloprofundus marisrubri]KTG10949.1 hypothetical protein AUR64_07180 [Haloprofundus marisrubri]
MADSATLALFLCCGVLCLDAAHGAHGRYRVGFLAGATAMWLAALSAAGVESVLTPLFAQLLVVGVVLGTLVASATGVAYAVRGRRTKPA